MWSALLLLTLPLAVQAAPSQGGEAPPPRGPDLVSFSELSMARYQPQNIDPESLAELAQQIVGRRFFVVERGGYQGEPVMNVQLLGKTLVLYDVPDYLKRMTTLLAELDRPASGAAPAPAPEPFITWEYTPRYLSMDAVVELLRPLEQTTVYQRSNLTLSQERRLLVVFDRPKRVNEIRELLARLDVPQDQVTITCWLLRGGSTGADQGKLPPALTEHLSRLVPGQSFRSIGFALLQSSVDTEQPISMQLAAPTDGPPYFLDLRPLAYDRESGSLTVSGCSLANAPGAVGLFSTSVLLRGGEYTVIGASGPEPVLVALRVDPVKK